MPANFQTSAPSYASTVTSKMFPSLFIQGFSLINKSNKHVYSADIRFFFFAKLNVLVNSFSDIDG